LVVALILGATNSFVINKAEKKAQETLSALKKKNRDSFRAMEGLKEDLASAEVLKTVIDDKTAKKFLTPTDRVHASELLERRAEEARLTHFSYSFSPEEKKSFDSDYAGEQRLGLCSYTFESDAPTDLDVYVFLDTIERTLPGSLAFEKFSMRRTAPKDATMTESNLHFKASGKWLSNGTAPIMGDTR